MYLSVVLGLKTAIATQVFVNVFLTILNAISTIGREITYRANQREFCNNSMDFHILSEYKLDHRFKAFKKLKNFFKKSIIDLIKI